MAAITAWGAVNPALANRVINIQMQKALAAAAHIVNTKWSHVADAARYEGCAVMYVMYVVNVEYMSSCLRCRTAGVAVAAAGCLSRLLYCLHPADWTTREAVLNTLRAVLIVPSNSNSGDGWNSSSTSHQTGSDDHDDDNDNPVDSGVGGGGGVDVRVAAAEGLAAAGVGLVAQLQEEGGMGAVVLADEQAQGERGLGAGT